VSPFSAEEGGAVLFLSIMTLAAALPAPGEGDWRAFDRRRRGVVVAPAHYDAASIERSGGRVRVRVRERLYLSGLPDWDWLAPIEIDCARRESRVLDPRRRRRAPPARMAPIEAGSMVDALAREVCPNAP
jgi:hypothetical protein